MNKDLLTETAGKIFETMPLINKRIFDFGNLPKQCHIPLSHMQVIFYLKKKESSSVSEIASVLGISRPNMTPIIDKLIREGFVERNTDDQDRRVIRVRLTKKAKEFEESHKRKLIDSLTQKLSSLDEDDLNKIQESMTTLYSIITKI